MIHATIFEAKTKLSELVKKAQAGETVVITSRRNKTRWRRSRRGAWEHFK